MRPTIPVLALCMLATSASAAILEPLVERKNGDWSAVLYRNATSDRLFCALESYDGETAFRIVRYKDGNATFLEIHNTSWDLMAGGSKFILSFSIKDENYKAELMGMRDAHGYSHDFTDNTGYLALIGMISQATSFEVQNSNWAKIATFRGRRSELAAADYGDCLKTDWLSEADQSTAIPPAAKAARYRFDQYPTAPGASGRPPKMPSFGGREKEFAAFRTRIKTGMRQGPNFAGRHSVVVIGCGTGCVFAVVGDNETGRLVLFPRGGEDNPGLQLTHRVDSSLMSAQWTDPNEGDKCVREYFSLADGRFELLDRTIVGERDACSEGPLQD